MAFFLFFALLWGGPWFLLQATSSQEALARQLEETSFSQGEKILLEFLEKNPEDARACFLLGRLQLQQQRLFEAQESLRRSIRLDSSFLPARLELADLYQKQGRFKEAITLLLAVDEKDSSDDRFLLQMASYAIDTRDYSEAVRVLQSIPRSERSVRFEELLAQAQMGLQNWDEAVSAFRRLLEKKPDNLAALRRLSVALLQKGEPAAAWETILEARRLTPNSVTVLADVARLGMQLKKLQESIPTLRRLRLMEPDNLEFLFLLANALTLHLELPEADRLLESYLKQRPEDAGAHLTRGYVLFLLGEFDKSETHLRKTIELEPENSEAPYHLGLIALRRGQDRQAEEMFRRVLTLSPGHGKATLELGKVQLQQGSLEEALQTLERAAGLIPTEPSVHYHLALLFHRLGRSEKAQEEMNIYSRLRKAGESP